VRQGESEGKSGKKEEECCIHGPTREKREGAPSYTQVSWVAPREGRGLCQVAIIGFLFLVKISWLLVYLILSCDICQLCDFLQCSKLIHILRHEANSRHYCIIPVIIPRYCGTSQQLHRPKGRREILGDERLSNAAAKAPFWDLEPMDMRLEVPLINLTGAGGSADAQETTERTDVIHKSVRRCPLTMLTVSNLLLKWTL
jgi:hypothetical protein